MEPNNKSVVRINRALSMLGICSRRGADVLIAEGLISINGVVITSPGIKISENDRILYQDKEYSLGNNSRKSRVWLYYKKRGLIVSHKCEQNRRTIFEDIKHKIRERVVSVGRLDLDSEGLIILTNNNDFARYAELPRTGWLRAYSVKFYGKLTKSIIDEIEKGICINDFQYAPIKLKNIKDNWCTLTLREGKNREIRRIFDHFGLMINRLIRVQYGPYKLNDMDIGEIIEVRPPALFR
jgi:23S rRNA pseudouridine2605 synthase